ncbi:MAG: hypothetical protein H2057_07695 [Alphaproteobacteria bacterium]|nr:hypothetical protein [Alphaproteobacteria bacterium]
MKNQIKDGLHIWGLIFSYAMIHLKIMIMLFMKGMFSVRWRISRNSNYYHKTMEATVFRFREGWRIARYGKFYGSFLYKEDAMLHVLNEYLHEISYDETITGLRSKKRDLRKRLFDVCQK